MRTSEGLVAFPFIISRYALSGSPPPRRREPSFSTSDTFPRWTMYTTRGHTSGARRAMPQNRVHATDTYCQRKLGKAPVAGPRVGYLRKSARGFRGDGTCVGRLCLEGSRVACVVMFLLAVCACFLYYFSLALGIIPGATSTNNRLPKLKTMSSVFLVFFALATGPGVKGDCLGVRELDFPTDEPSFGGWSTAPKARMNSVETVRGFHGEGTCVAGVGSRGVRVTLEKGGGYETCVKRHSWNTLGIRGFSFGNWEGGNETVARNRKDWITLGWDSFRRVGICAC